jgi:hypothetical protein
MNKKFYSFIIGSIMSIILAVPTLGNEIYFTAPNALELGDSDSANIFIVKQPRGEIISTAILQITNPGKGEIGVYIHTIAHVDVDETAFAVYLERWIPSREEWANVAYFTFTFNKDDYPDDDLGNKMLSFNIVGQPDDCYYRLKGSHMVTLNGYSEVLSTQTDGILITK